METQLPTSSNSDVSELPERHCGRCQCWFEADPALFFQSDWALCPACTKILLPKPGAPILSARLITSVARRQPRRSDNSHD